MSPKTGQLQTTQRRKPSNTMETIIKPCIKRFCRHWHREAGIRSKFRITRSPPNITGLFSKQQHSSTGWLASTHLTEGRIAHTRTNQDTSTRNDEGNPGIERMVRVMRTSKTKGGGKPPGKAAWGAGGSGRCGAFVGWGWLVGWLVVICMSKLLIKSSSIHAGPL